MRRFCANWREDLGNLSAALRGPLFHELRRVAVGQRDDRGPPILPIARDVPRPILGRALPNQDALRAFWLALLLALCPGKSDGASVHAVRYQGKKPNKEDSKSGQQRRHESQIHKDAVHNATSPLGWVSVILTDATAA